MNKDMLTFLMGILVVGVLLLLSTPLILMNVFHGDLSGPWIGFWGSFAGGILGTAGVIYVAHIQNKNQLKNLENVEIYNRERLSIQTKLNMLNEFKISLNNFKNEIDKYKRYYTLLREEVNEYNAYSNSSDNVNEQVNIFNKIQYEFKLLGPSYFSDVFSTIENNSNLLSVIENVDFNGLTYRNRENYENLDKLVDVIKFESLERLSSSTNIFDDNFTLQFQLISESLNHVERELVIAQKRLLKDLDKDISS